MKYNDYEDRLIPSTHLIKSIRARGSMNLEDGMSELLDNSLGHGRAQNITVLMHNGKGIGVQDDGIGISDINQMFKLGDSGSYGDIGNRGLYGVGTKDSSIWLGDVLTVETHHNGRLHNMSVNWDDVDKSGRWPRRYRGAGIPSSGRGTTVLITKPHRYFVLASSERLAKVLGQRFAPALRDGATITIVHMLKNGEEQQLQVVPFEPPDLTDVIDISGEIATDDLGVLKWSGRAGLSHTLTDSTNGVNIAFTHRMVEQANRDAFKGKSASTLYVEVTLDSTTPWKYALSDHKTKVVKHRGDLMDSIHEQIAELLDRASELSTYLALKGITLPIETQLTKALKAVGVLYVDEDEEPEEGGDQGHSPNPVKKGKRIRNATAEGSPAKKAGKPTGVRIEYADQTYLKGKLYGWTISGKEMIVILDRAEFEAVVDYPAKVRDREFMRLVTSYLSHAIEAEYWRGDKDSLTTTITPRLYRQIEEWASGPEERVAPYLNRAILNGAAA